VSGGVGERRFDLDVDGRVVPALLWAPSEGAGPRPLVVLGHGATRHKRVDYLLALARRLVRDHGFACVAIDAPGHGDRRAAPADDLTVFSEFLAEWSREGTVEDMLADWAATIQAVRSLDEVGDGALGYWGLSMGTIYGVPLAAIEPRVQVAVFGLMGLVGPTASRLAADARRVTCPVTFLQQWDDSLLPRKEVLDLFDAIGSLDKRLHVHPGDHAAVPVEELEFSVTFLARHLA
jgi:pimeloyl-ACP methyl ester carboxylesterase